MVNEMPIVAIDNDGSDWAGRQTDLKNKRFTIGDNAMPTFYYQTGDIQVQDNIAFIDQPFPLLDRKIVIHSGHANRLGFLLADASKVQTISKGLYRVDDFYYILISDPGSEIIQFNERSGELIYGFQGKSNLHYSIIW